MGRIIAVNLAHWRKRQQKRTEQAQQDKREYHENVQEMIETANQGRLDKVTLYARTGFCFQTESVFIIKKLDHSLCPSTFVAKETVSSNAFSHPDFYTKENNFPGNPF